MPAVTGRFPCILLLAGLLVGSCSSGPAATAFPTTQAVSLPPAAQTPRQPAPTPAAPSSAVLRFGLVGQPTSVNAWALFDEAGASYANYALHYHEYPSLYRLSVPARQFEAYIAEGMPSAAGMEGDFYTATVKLPAGLYWSNGTPLSAEDVAFTADTALAFRLRLDWSDAYDPALLDRVEAPDRNTVKFYFKGPFDAGAWQYGALQGPILNRTYWASLVAVPSGLLPAQDLVDSWQKTMNEAADLQARIDADNAQLISGTLPAQSRNEVDVRIRRNQDELNSLNSKTARLQDEFNLALDQARQALFALPAEGEPTFGPYLRYEGSGDTFTRLADRSYPYTAPAFLHLQYTIFPDEQTAMASFEQDQVDVVLAPGGLSGWKNTVAVPGSSATFLAFNPAHTPLAEPALHRALACMLDPQVLAGEEAYPLTTLVPAGPWSDAESLAPCSDTPAELKLQKAAQRLSQAGYTWRLDPNASQGGSGISSPAGVPLGPLTLLTLSADVDPLRYRAAEYIAAQAQPLGFAISVQGLDPTGLRYAVYSTRDYDMAILGWQLAEYPAYLCDWFLPPGPFGFQDDRLRAGCQLLSSTADLPTAMQAANEIQSVSMEYLPLIPLYSGLQYEAIRNVDYPFRGVQDGISGLYGAPDLAVP